MSIDKDLDAGQIAHLRAHHEAIRKMEEYGKEGEITTEMQKARLDKYDPKAIKNAGTHQKYGAERERFSKWKGEETIVVMRDLKTNQEAAFHINGLEPHSISALKNVFAILNRLPLMNMELYSIKPENLALCEILDTIDINGVTKGNVLKAIGLSPTVSTQGGGQNASGSPAQKEVV